MRVSRQAMAVEGPVGQAIAERASRHAMAVEGPVGQVIAEKGRLDRLWQ